MPLYKKSLLILLALLGAVLIGATYGYYREQDSIALDAATTEHVEPPRKVTVYVSGEVKKPGLVTLDEDKRVADAVNAAGGVIETADVDHINMAAHLEDGMQVRVPMRLRDAGEKGGAASTGRQADGKINLNTATEKELQELPGIGPAMSARIVEYRESNGAFQSIDDIKKVRGIGASKFEKLKDRVTL